nr:trypsin-like peptidase domain-containing protein [Nostoc sp. DedQUE03]MDZ7973366.1 trypsin-like peptidase domain-containing protein [Nostoc sp. DedQUE03]
MRFAGGLSAVLLGIAIVIVQPVATALTPSEVSEIAKQITVRIDGANIGSGVIIEHQGNVYNVVTCWHVVQLKGSYTVQTPDGKKYTFNNSQVKRFPGVDLAVFQFTSNENYRVAEKGNSDQVALGTSISVAGYPQGTSDMDFRRGAISRLVTNPKDGYAFVYDIGGFPGMSGGAILDEQGKLVGIHGRATTRPDTNAVTVLGIPLKTYLSLASSAQPPAITSPPENTASKFIFAKTLTGHSTKVIKISDTYSYIEGRVYSVAISADGKTLTSGSGDGTIKIWNLATGQEIRTFKGHSDEVTSVAFSPDGRTLASGSLDKTIKIWNPNTGKVLRILQGNSRRVHSIAISPDGKTLATGGWGDTINIWNIATGQGITNLDMRGEWIEPVAFSPDSRTLAAGISDGRIIIWNAASGKVIRTLDSHYGVNSVAFSPDGRTLASGSNDATIKIWNIATGQEEIATLNGHSKRVNSVAFSPDGRTLASGSDDATIKIWRLSE